MRLTTLEPNLASDLQNEHDNTDYLMAPLEIIDILVSMTSLAPAGRSFKYTIRQQ